MPFLRFQKKLEMTTFLRYASQNSNYYNSYFQRPWPVYNCCCLIWPLNGSEAGARDHLNVPILKIMLLYGLEVCNKTASSPALLLYSGPTAEWSGKWIFNDLSKGLEFVCTETCDTSKNTLKYHTLRITECWSINMCITDVSD